MDEIISRVTRLEEWKAEYEARISIVPVQLSTLLTASEANSV